MAGNALQSPPYLNRAQIRLFRREFGESIEDFTRVIEMIGSDPNPEAQSYVAASYWNRGHAFQEKGDSRRAQADQAEAKRRNPAINPR